MGNKAWTSSDSDIPYTGYFRVKLIVAITNVSHNAPSANSLRAFPLTGQSFVVFARGFSSHFRLTAPARSNSSSRSEDSSSRQFGWYRRAPARDTGQQLPNPVAKRTAAVIVVNIACVTRTRMADHRVADRPCFCNIHRPGVFGSGPAKSSRPQNSKNGGPGLGCGGGLTPMDDGVTRSQTIV